MELKYSKRKKAGLCLSRSNRTFMELKLLTYKVRKFATWCSNRTFMELKYMYCHLVHVPTCKF